MKIATRLILLICCIITFQYYQFLFAQVIEQKLLPGDGVTDANFGYSVSISGDYAIVGANQDSGNGIHYSGSAYLFKKDGATWIEEQKLFASYGAEVDLFGCSVSISGDYAIVGAQNNNDYGVHSGSAYIFRRNGTTWIEEQKLLASDGATGDVFGCSVSISENYAIVGAYLSGSNDQGAAYIFRRDSTTWIQEKKLTASDASLDDWFGFTVSISGFYVIVGAYLNDDNGSNSGSAYIFKKDSANWIEEQKLLPSDGVSGDQFGHTVSISVDCVIVGIGHGSPGAAYIFRRNGTNWIEEQKLLASDGDINSGFGYSVSISGDYTIIGDRSDDDNGLQSGSAYIFKKDDTTWIEEQKLLASDGAAEDFFGCSVSISGDYIIVGANQNDDNGSNSGSAYIYMDFVVVPVALSSFTARLDNNFVVLNWSTATETNNMGFDVERFDKSWKTIGYVEGNGTTTNQKEYSYIDKDLVNGKYFYRLKQIDFNGIYVYSELIEVDVISLCEYALEQNFPNPFNPITTIGYVLKEKTNAKLIILNAIGEEIAVLINGEQDKGFHKVDFNAANLPSGVYFFRLRVGSFNVTKKMIFLK